jgi:DNA-binding PadR family transcriptional regulator
MGNLSVAANTVGKSTNWMKGSPLKGALLALLLELDEPTHPYLLATLLAERLGSAFRVEPEAVYKMLKALEQAEMVASEKRENETGSWRRQNVYRPTDLTGRAVSAWMAAPVSDVAARPELLVKIAFARPSDIPVLLDALNALEMRRMDRLDECQSAEVPMSSWVGLATNVACTWTEEHLHADLRWIMATRDWMREYAAKHEVFRR